MAGEARVLRRLVAADAAAAASAIHAAFAAQSALTDPPSAALDETVETVAAAILAEGGAGVVDGAGFAGVVLWLREGDGLYLRRLAVRPEWRRQGLAGQLVRAAEDEARRLGLAWLRLGTRLVLADNRALFAACGFRETGTTTHAGYAAPTSVSMEKPVLSR